MSEVTIVCKGVELVVGGSGETESREGGAVWKECNGFCVSFPGDWEDG